MILCVNEIMIKYHDIDSLLHLMYVITGAHASTCATSLMHVKHSKHHFCLWQLLPGTIEQKKWKKKQKNQI